MRKNILAVLAVVLAIVAPCFAEEPKLPEGVDPLPKAMIDKMKDLLANAERYRGLKCMHRLASGTLKEDALRVKMKMMFEEELPPAKMRPLEAALKAFGFIPETMDLGKYLPELFTSQVGGYYDPRRQYLVLVQREGGGLGKKIEERMGKAEAQQLAQQMDDICMVHEMTHAIQDQHFNLQKFQIENPLSDEGAARTALIEGDATLIMYNFSVNMRIEDIPFADTLLGWLLKDPDMLIDMSPDMPGAKEIKEAPAYFREGLLFSYMQGYIFCLGVRKAGGQALLDHAFTKDPPRSTEQIMHPDKWYGKRDDPIEIVMPDLAAQLPGWTKGADGSLGELNIRILLNGVLKDKDASEKVAAGWGGDHFAVYEKDGQRALVWVTDWDLQKDATEFTAAARQLGDDWKIETAGPKRVTVTHAKLDADRAAAIHKALGGAQMKEPENKRIDIASVRNNALKKAPEPNKTSDAGKKDDVADLQKLINDPEFEKALKGVGKEGGLDLGALINDPKIQDLAKKLLEGQETKTEPGTTPDRTKKDATAKDKILDGDLDINKLLNDPNLSKALEGLGGDKQPDFSALAKAFAPNLPDGTFSKDGREYSNAALGVSLKLPEAAKGWSLRKEADMPMLLAMGSNADGSANVNVAAQNMPMALPIENMGPMMEMGLKIAFKNYQVHKQGVIGEGATKAYEFQVSGEQAGVRARVTSRYYMRGGKLVVLSASAQADQWAANEKVLGEILDAIKLSEPVKK